MVVYACGFIFVLVQFLSFKHTVRDDLSPIGLHFNLILAQKLCIFIKLKWNDWMGQKIFVSMSDKVGE